MGVHNIQNPRIRLPPRPPPAFPKPMEALHETPIPPFLSKTYDLTDDPSLDGIISWGDRGRSFVVWDPVEFARLILPRNFKHANFSSFVRQLNTYGFRKIDTYKWEFRNGGFVQGQRHLLKKIQRRKSHHQLEGRPSTAWHDEIRELRRERRLMVEEVMGLQDEQRLTVQHMQVVKEKLEAAETRHKRMISFLARLINSGIPSSSRTMREVVKHRTDLCSSDVTPGSDQPSLHQIGEDEFNYAPKKDDSVGAMNPPADEHFASSPQNVVVEDGVPGFLIAGDAWSMGLEAGDPWGYVSNYYDTPDLESRLLDVSEIGSMQLEGSSDIKEWLDDESPINN
ncbi:hypothetical protein SASPL_111738 [Salvia splendens]|uniref:HSF-type DNA-binding domain-containing protein n=1 Tax=Salvia splendens TaxID=180675 RepID=A0A8X8YBB0_SALSN|nr:heat stress transcription factor A-3-like [Salvia splendens]KAG6427492.1 hypothetical protein SASPL_111738 [Salvia splendens]